MERARDIERKDVVDTIQKVYEERRRNVAETARRVACTLGVMAELLIAAGGDAPAQADVVTIYGLRTGLAIVGWWIIASAVGKIVELFQGCPVWHFRGGCPSVGEWIRVPWGRLTILTIWLLVIAGVVAFRIWMPTSCGLVIR